MTVTEANLLKPATKSFFFGQLAIWGVYGLALKAMWVGYNAPPTSWFISYIFTGFFASYLLGFCLWKIKSSPIIKQCVFALIFATSIALAWRIGFNIIDFHIFDREGLSNAPYFKYLYRGSSAVLIMYGWGAFYLLLAYYHKYQEQKTKTIKTQLQLKVAEIRRLQHQISPHLLFNALHSLDTLLLKQDVKKARDMVSQLSLFLRDSLTNVTTETIPLTDEIEQTKRYLQIESIRFGDRLKVTWDCQLLDYSPEVPRLILQPLVENAIKHGVEKTIEGSSIHIKCLTDGSELILCVNNTQAPATLADASAGQSISSQHHNGIGLTATKERLELMYGENASLNIEQSAATFSVKIKILIGSVATST